MNNRIAVLLAVLLSTSALAQNLRVVIVPWVATDSAVPHPAYNGHATTFKAIARGGNGSYLVEWDFQGDGVYDVQQSTTNRYNLSARFTYPNQATTTTFNARVRVSSGAQFVTATYPVRVYADVPSDPANANNRQLQIMRSVAIDDGLWYLHNQLGRSGNEEDPLLGAQAYAAFVNGGSAPHYTNAQYLEALGRTGHYAAFPAAYIGDMPDPSANTARWRDDPYAEDAMRVLNYLLLQSQVVGGLAAVDEGNLTGFYPEVTSTPIPGTDDGFGLLASASGYTGPVSGVVRALAVSNLAGYVAQVGDTNRVLGRRFEFLLQQYVDALVWAQNEAGISGSWYYSPNQSTDLLGELGDGTMDAAEALATAEEFMGSRGVIVPNLAKARLLQYIQANLNQCPAGGTGGTVNASFNNMCDFANSAAIVFALRWAGANTFASNDTRYAFPGYNGITRGNLRGWYDSSITFITNVFNGTSVGGYNWDNGFVESGNWARVDGLGDHYSMIHWARAARVGTPEIVNFGNNDYVRRFSQYLVNNQASDGNWNWAASTPLNNQSDGYFGAAGRVAIAALTLAGDSRPPFIIGQSSVATAPEGTPINFTSIAETPGNIVWAFGNGATQDGANISYPYPDNGAYNATVTQTSADGQTSVDTIPVIITNVAPVANAGPDLTVNEGSAVPFAGTFSDPGMADTFAFSWTWSDGTANSSVFNPSHTFRDNGFYNVTFRVTDDDNGTSVDSVVVTVNNVAPTITSTPTTTGTEGTPYTYTLTFTDPGTLDSHTCSAPIKPAGSALMGCQFIWTPGSSATNNNPVELCVTDDDGGKACQTFSIAVSFTDADGDGLSDSWEINNFGNITSQDQFGDPDADGRNNLQEFNGVTDPLTFDGPGAVQAIAPMCGTTVTSNRPTLTISNPTAAGTYTYQFQIYSDAALTQLVDSASSVPSGGPNTTSWTVGTSLAENGVFRWRARAHDGIVSGQWSSVCAFTVNAVAELPTAPEIDTPNFGVIVSSLQPTLTVKNATDPEGDTLTYEFEVRLSGAVVASAQNVVETTGTTAWQVTGMLTAGADYVWRARAVSPGGAGPWSALGTFHVALPSTGVRTPTLVSPQNGTTVPSLTPTLVFLPDGDVNTFDWELSTSESFTPVVESGSDVTTTRITLANPLTEDTRYCWRVRSDNGQEQSAWASACFIVSVTDGAPSVPTLHNPSNDSVVTTLTPVFSWAAAVDPEGTAVTYELELSEGSTVIATMTAIGGTATVAAEPLKDGSSYSWRVRAVSAGAASAFSSANAFKVDLPEIAQPEPQPQPEPQAPAQGCGCSSMQGFGFLPALLLLIARRRRVA